MLDILNMETVFMLSAISCELHEPLKAAKECPIVSNYLIAMTIFG